MEKGSAASHCLCFTDHGKSRRPHRQYFQKPMNEFEWLQISFPCRYHTISPVVQLPSHVWLFATPWTAALQASLFFTISPSSLKLMSIESVMPSNHLILCCPLLLLPSIFPSIGVFSNEPAFRIRWPKYCSFSFSVTSSSEYSGLISSRIDWLDFLILTT